MTDFSLKFPKAGTSSSGTVTSVSVVTANGISAVVANPSTTPAITLTLGAITPTTVNGNTLTIGTGTLTLSTFMVTATGNATISGTNTGDQTIALTGEATGSGTGSFAVTLTNSAVIGKVLTGYVSGAGTVVATDNILQAIQKLNGNTSALVTGVSSVNSLTGAVALTGTANRVTVSVANVFDISSSYVGQSSITTVGTLTSGATGSGFTIALTTSTVTGLLTGTNGGTGVNNGSKTITLGGNLTTTGAFNATLSVPQTTTWTLPNTANETLAGLGTTQSFSAVNTFSNSTDSTTTTTGAVIVTGGVGIAKALVVGTTITANPNVDSTHILGQARLYSATTGNMMLSQFSISTTNGYAIQQTSAGATTVNGSSLILAVGGSPQITITSLNFSIKDGANFAFNTVTGSKLGLTNLQKIGFWNTAPDVQPTNAIAAAAFVANTSGIANDTATWGGYTGGQIVAALKRIGLLA